MNIMQGSLSPPGAPRRIEVLAFVVERIARSGISPAFEEIGRAMQPPVGITRVKQLVEQLVALGLIERDPGAQRGIRIRDLVACRAVLEDALGSRGWVYAHPLGALLAPSPCSKMQLPLMPDFEHLPDID